MSYYDELPPEALALELTWRELVSDPPQHWREAYAERQAAGRSCNELVGGWRLDCWRKACHAHGLGHFSREGLAITSWEAYVTKAAQAAKRKREAR